MIENGEVTIFELDSDRFVRRKKASHPTGLSTECFAAILCLHETSPLEMK